MEEYEQLLSLQPNTLQLYLSEEYERLLSLQFLTLQM